MHNTISECTPPQLASQINPIIIVDPSIQTYSTLTNVTPTLVYDQKPVEARVDTTGQPVNV